MTSQESSAPKIESGLLKYLSEPRIAKWRRESTTRMLYLYHMEAWKRIDPAPYLDNWHIQLIAEYLQLVTMGKCQRLIINIPPRYGKSLLTSVTWPTWSWVFNPRLKFVFASYSASLSFMHAGLRSQLLHDDWWTSRWGDKVWIVPGHDRRDEMMNNHLGEMFTSSVTGSTTGRGGDVIVIDDPLNPQQAASDAMRESANTWFRQTMASRLNNKKRGAIVVIMQRLHEEDVTGTALAEGGWVHLKIPAVAVDRERIVFPVSGRVIVREPGDVLWPERETREMLDFLKEKRMGSYAFSGQYQQEPAPDEGGILKKGWWQFYNLTEPHHTMTPRQILNQLPPMNTIAISWDMAFKDLDESDYCAGSVWGRSGPNYYLLDLIYDHMDFVVARQAVEAFYRKWPMASQILIEDKANGTAIISSLRKKIHRLIAINPTESKIARAYAVSPLIEAKNVYLPDRRCAPWIDEFILQCARFPNAAHDDFVDSLTQALTRLSKAVPEERIKR